LSFSLPHWQSLTAGWSEPTSFYFSLDEATLQIESSLSTSRIGGIPAAQLQCSLLVAWPILLLH
jgi:hypothetical protein